MWSSRPAIARAIALGGVLILSACTVEPLYGNRTPVSLGGAAESASVRQALQSIEVPEVRDRVAQQVRNELLFALNGGKRQAGDRYRVTLVVTSADSGVNVESGVLAATAAQVRIQARYTLIDNQTNQTITSGQRVALASYDRTSQRFANDRASRDAENRAARDVALQIRLALSQALAGA